jgi:non-ribosomal peptide synthetase component F
MRRRAKARCARPSPSAYTQLSPQAAIALALSRTIVIPNPEDFEPIPVELLESALPQLVERTARLHPGHTAITTAAKRLTYEQVNHQANALAHSILSKVGAGQEPIGMMFGHGWNAILSLLAILKSGRPYLPLEASYPTTRIQGDL